MVLPAKKAAATVAISRMGEKCAITEPTGATSTDGYGKTQTDSAFTEVATEDVVRTYGSRGSGPSQSRQSGGRLPADSPLLILRHDSVAEAGFRVEYLGETYELDALTPYPSHIEATTTLVN